MISRATVRTLLARGAEVVLAIGVVLVFFLACTGILILAFPKGIGIGKLVRYEEIARNRSVPATEAPRTGWQSIVGLLSHVQRTVKSKPSNSIVWSAAQPGQTLVDQDAVQTYDASRATIEIEGADQLEVGERSMVVLRNIEKDLESGARRASVVLLGGELRANLAGRHGAPASLSVTTGPATARIETHTGRPSDVRISATPDQTSTFAVYRGAAEVRVGGKSVVVGADWAVSVGPTGEFGEPVRLPAVVEATAPADGFRRSVRSVPAAIEFAWSLRAAVDRYRLVVARDAAFHEIVLDREITEPAFAHGNLREGRYHWKISGLSGPVEGPASRPRQLEIVRDTEAPVLSVEFPAGPVRARTLVVRGTTEPGARVFVGRENFVVSELGEFEGAVELQGGINVIVVEAADDAGNIAYESRRIRTVK